jgi:adenylosuccinate lyase
MRPEIAEIRIPRGEDVSSSSTMPHKQNPSGLENIESLWKVDMPKIITVYMDQISENCRDLTNSASQRYIPEILDIFDYAIRRATRIAKKIETRPENMIKNLNLSRNTITAEPLHLLLESVGRHTARKEVEVLADRAMAEKKSVVKLAERDAQLKPYVRKLGVEQKEILMNPEKYTGKAKEKTLEIVEKWKSVLDAYSLKSAGA